MRVLIAEDDRVSALVLTKTLEKLGHGVTVARSGAEAWDLLQQEPFPLVISDWMMPEMNGVELCSQIRAQHSDSYTYIILLTAKDTRQDRQEAMQAGADDFLIKPLDRDELIARLNVAERILTMQAELRNRSVSLEKMRGDLARQNEQLEDMMTFLRIANRRFTELFEGLPAACFSYDEEGRIHEWNRAASEMFGYLPHEVVDRPFWEVLREDNSAKQQRNIQQKKTILRRLFSGEALTDIEYAALTKDGRRIEVLCNMIPMSIHEGRITGAISANIDITHRKALERQLEVQLRLARDLNRTLEKQREELQQANTQLAELSITDGLTGLRNHRHFREELEKRFLTAYQQQTPLSVLLLDVDHFKHYNDTYGHPAGDEVLRAVADLLRACARPEDLVARYGGEEFVVLTSGLSSDMMAEYAQRIRQTVERHAWPLRHVTVSIGVAMLTQEVDSSSDLVDRADKALYHSKRQGRNRVTLYPVQDSDISSPLHAAA